MIVLYSYLTRSKIIPSIPVKKLDTQDNLIEEYGEPKEDLVKIPLEDGNKEYAV